MDTVEYELIDGENKGGRDKKNSICRNKADGDGKVGACMRRERKGEPQYTTKKIVFK